MEIGRPKVNLLLSDEDRSQLQSAQLPRRHESHAVWGSNKTILKRGLPSVSEKTRTARTAQH